MLSAAAGIVLSLSPGRFCGDLLLFSSTIDQPEDAPRSDAWCPYADGKIETHEIAASHEQMMTEPSSIAQIGLILSDKNLEILEIPDGASLSHQER